MTIRTSKTPRAAETKVRKFDELGINKKYVATRISPKLVLTYLGLTANQTHSFKSSGLVSGVMKAKNATQLASWGLIELTQEQKEEAKV